MILIADSGSTKTTWALLNPENNQVLQLQTSGINPFLQTEEEIYSLLLREFSREINEDLSIYFYGAGCANPEKKEVVRRALQRLFKTENIYVDSDLMCAAKSLLGSSPGIAAILGTGSNSCYYNGEKIESNVSPLGYILGDEGSGAVMGKKLLGDILKGQLPEHLCQLFFDTYQITPAEILDRVYKKTFPNRYMAGYTHFISTNIGEKPLRDLVKSSFADFFKRNIRQYEQAVHLPVNFTGSIAWYFQRELKEVASELGFRIGVVTKDPMEGLINFYLKK